MFKETNEDPFERKLKDNGEIKGRVLFCLQGRRKENGLKHAKTWNHQILYCCFLTKP